MTPPQRTPAYVVSEARLLAAVKGLRLAFAAWAEDGFAIAYAVKANPHPQVCEALFRAGAWAEVANLREMRLALAHGVPGEQIVINGPAKDAALIRLALRSGALLGLESRRQLELALSLAIQEGHLLKPLFRIAPGRGVESRFGLAASDLARSIELAREAGVESMGVHAHWYERRWPPEPSGWRRRMAAATRAARRITKAGGRVSHLNLGGGLPEPIVEEPEAGDFTRSARPYLEVVARGMCAFPAGAAGPPRIVLEPGRFLVQDAGEFWASVVDMKRLSASAWMAVLDAGVCSLASLPSWSGEVELVESGPRRRTRAETVLVGPSCMEDDVLARVAFGRVPEVGDWCRFTRVGAYQYAHRRRFAEDEPHFEWRASNDALLGH